jgi:hypothetical protein
VDPKKGVAMKYWSCHKTLKGLQMFAGLQDYYKKFLKKNGKFVPPFIDLLKKIFRME